MENLSEKIVKKEYKPIKVIQFGEGNFLRAFVDWIIQKMNDSGKYEGHVVVVQPLDFGRVKDLEKQNGLYTLYLQGISNGETIRTHEIIDVLDDFINPYSDYDKFLSYARSEELEVVISNTTEAGITLDLTDTNIDSTPKTFPGKVVALLDERYRFFKGDKTKGLSFICCELIDNNGDELKRCVNSLIKEMKLSEDFVKWVNDYCYFTSTLVDRIVPGYPRDEIDEITKELGYIDSSIVKGEIFHLWVLNSDSHIEQVFPCDQVGLNVKYVPSIKPYKQRKVKILNGCHTCMVPVSYLYGIDAVRESVLDPYVGKFMKDFVYEEVIPTIDLPHDDMVSFADSVFERYLNPFVHHLLMSIALNSISKYKARVLPTVKDYLSIKGVLPLHPVFSLAALITFYQGKRGEEMISLKDEKEYLDYFSNLFSKGLSEEDVVKDVLSQSSMWGEDLNNIEGLTQKVTEYYKAINSKGMKAALQEFIGK